MNPTQKKAVKEYFSAHQAMYGCWACKATGVTLYRVGKGLGGKKVYVCKAHRQVEPPRR